ncbi:phytoene synthase [Tetragenococcus halophilus subsp. halophilus]|nr:phytoene synthase [Tetragenococcus halophilus NBRC 12172]GBD61306.1 phytoene synthase [Tetragenococcus halophilus subsp. halophilus]GBD63330.1 phytoene synthase [Tetragenococcus halophilus subsp. flandriensis]GBD70736.1 phytoene synthase [Tetragenococcus halophilus subsp. halophilus]GBD73569.1 phytoene synthase [Tetragenococcus halophilus subsp. halophilus]
MKPTDNFKKRKKEFDYCEKIIQRHSKSFYAAFSQLPKKKAQSIYAIYAFCRMADDIVDEKKMQNNYKNCFNN